VPYFVHNSDDFRLICGDLWCLGRPRVRVRVGRVSRVGRVFRI